jgi:photosystem II stability/assembly factor-like uncharacterized protein
MNLPSIRTLSLTLAFASAVLAPPAASAAEATTLAELRQQTHFHGIAVDRADPSRLYLATHHGFFLVTSDGKATRLSPVQDFMGFTPHPADAAILYASGHPAGGGNLGFIMSTDGGASWVQVSPGIDGPVDFHQMDVSPADPNVVYGVYSGLQVSHDAGRSWTMAGPAPEGLIDLAASSASADRLYAATKTGLWLSDDAGKSWLSAAFPSGIVSMVTSGPGGRLFAFVLGQGLVGAEERAPASWTGLSNGFGDRYILHLAVDPANPDRLYATTQENDVLASSDGGRSWKPYGQ